jgi:hypothetical protein
MLNQEKICSPKEIRLFSGYAGLWSALSRQMDPKSLEIGSPPGEAGHTRALPDVQVVNLAGLLEALAEKPDNHADIYKIVEELKVDSNQLFLLQETAELLGFATVYKGDIALTTLGQTFVDAFTLGCKEIFAARIRRLTMFRWLLNMQEESVAHKLELEFPPAEAEKQVDVAVNWGLQIRHFPVFCNFVPVENEIKRQIRDSVSIDIAAHSEYKGQSKTRTRDMQEGYNPATSVRKGNRKKTSSCFPCVGGRNINTVHYFLA